MLICIGIAILTVCAVLAYALLSVSLNGSRFIVSAEDLPSNADAILVLGAGLKSDGTPSDILRDRLDTALDIYRTGICSRFLLSGDHGSRNYNEVGAMKRYLISKEVPEDAIFLDHAGFSTYDSMYRARDIFLIRKVIVITTAYHLPRALYIARKLGLDAWGIPSDKHEYIFIRDYTKREYLARIKDFFKVHIFCSKPVYLGEPIPIQTSVGSMTN